MQFVYDSTVYDIGIADKIIKGKNKIMAAESISAAGTVHRQVFNVKSTENIYEYQRMPEDIHDMLEDFFISNLGEPFQVIDDIDRVRNMYFTNPDLNSDYNSTEESGNHYFRVSFSLKEVSNIN